MNIHLVTSNADKIREAKQILEYDVQTAAIELDEIQELDAMKIADHKARQAWEKMRSPVVVWDTSVYIDCLNGFPGPLIKWFWKQVGLEKICDMAHHFDNRKVSNETILTYFDGTELHHFSGQIKGTISDAPRGDNGWAWDSIFIPDGETETYGEMSQEKMIQFRSHTIALLKLREFLISR